MRKIVLTALALGSLAPLILSAHPHVWVDMRAELVLGATAWEGVWAEWRFDPLMSSLVLQDTDLNRNRRFEPAELRRVEEGYFRNLENFGYFVFAWADDRPLSVGRPRDFSARMDGEKLVYRFFYPLNHPLPRGRASTLRFSMYDETYYADLGFVRSEPVKITASGGRSASFTIVQNPARAYFSGTVLPEEVVVQVTP